MTSQRLPAVTAGNAPLDIEGDAARGEIAAGQWLSSQLQKQLLGSGCRPGVICGTFIPPLSAGAGVVAARGAGELTRVGRWMSKAEFETMSNTGRVVEGAGGRTSVIRPPNPGSYTAAPPGSVYAELDVPTSVLRQGGRPDWAIIPGPNITTRIFGHAPLEAAPATCIVCVIGP